jgi:hypothetical protein
MTGLWSPSIAHPKQNLCVADAPQATVGTTVASDDLEDAEGHETVYVQEGYGQYLRFGLDATK